MPTPHLSTRQLADRWGKQPQTLRAWRLKGIGPTYIRLGLGLKAHVAYRLVDVETWEATHTFTSTSAETSRNEV